MYNVVYMLASARFFCVVGPKSPKADNWWPDIAFQYLSALRERIAVRAISIGAAYLNVPKNDPQWSHWLHIRDLFTTRLSPRYINIICCPPNLPMGSEKKRGELAPDRIPEIDDAEMGHPGANPSVHAQMVESARSMSDPNEVVYEPETALIALRTKGRINIAITGCTPSIPSRAEMEALREYSMVACTRPEDAKTLRGLDIHALEVRPKSFPTVVSSLIEDFDE